MVEPRGFRRPPRRPRGLEDELKMGRLARVGYVDDPVGLVLEDAIPDRRHVCRVVAEAAVALDDHERLLVLRVRREDDLGDAARVRGIDRVGDKPDLVQV